MVATAAPTPDWRLAAVLLVLVATAACVSLVADLGVTRDEVTASLRAVAQLAVVSTAIAAVLSSAWWSLGFAVLMFTIASATSARRLKVPPRRAPLVGLAVALG